MKKILLLSALLVGISFNAQTRQAYVSCPLEQTEEKMDVMFVIQDPLGPKLTDSQKKVKRVALVRGLKKRHIQIVKKEPSVIASLPCSQISVILNSGLAGDYRTNTPFKPE